MDIAAHRPAEIRESGTIDAVVKSIQQREIDVTAVKAQIKRRTAYNLPLDAKIRIIRQIETEEIDRDVPALHRKGCARTFHRNIAVHAVHHVGTAG